jgi:hypothetical protein
LWATIQKTRSRIRVGISGARSSSHIDVACSLPASVEDAGSASLPQQSHPWRSRRELQASFALHKEMESG